MHSIASSGPPPLPRWRGGRSGAFVVFERVLLWSGVALLAWCGAVLVWRRHEQAEGARVLAREAAAGGSASARPSLSSGDVVGQLTIPKIGLSAIAREGTDAGILRFSLGHIPGTALPSRRGNTAFAGHRDGFFRRLGLLRRNDAIRFATPHGTFLYRVDWTRVVSPQETWVLDRTRRASLTLITCYPFHYIGSAPLRFVVRAHRVHA